MGGRESVWEFPEFADVPRPVAAGQPIMTLLAQGDTIDQVELRQREAVRKAEERWTR